MMRIQRYDQCGEYIDGFDVQVKCLNQAMRESILSRKLILCDIKGWDFYQSRGLHQH